MTLSSPSNHSTLSPFCLRSASAWCGHLPPNCRTSFSRWNICWKMIMKTMKKNEEQWKCVEKVMKNNKQIMWSFTPKLSDLSQQVKHLLLPPFTSCWKKKPETSISIISALNNRSFHLPRNFSNQPNSWITKIFCRHLVHLLLPQSRGQVNNLQIVCFVK